MDEHVKTLAQTGPGGVAATTLLETPAGARELYVARQTGLGPRMQIGLSKMQQVLSLMRDDTPEEAAALLARMHYMVKHGFPRRFDTTKGRRTALGIDDVLRVVIGTELLFYGITHAALAEAIDSEWSSFSTALAIAWRTLSSRDAGEDAKTVLRIRCVERRNVSTDVPYPLTVEAFSPTDVKREGMAILGGRSAMLLDAAETIRSFVHAVPDALAATAADVRADLDRFARNVLDDGHPIEG